MPAATANLLGFFLVSSLPIWYFSAMRPRGKSHAQESFSLNQRRRRRPSRVKSRIPVHFTPGENLQLACELSDLCIELNKAARRKK